MNSGPPQDAPPRKRIPPVAFLIWGFFGLNLAIGLYEMLSSSWLAIIAFAFVFLIGVWGSSMTPRALGIISLTFVSIFASYGFLGEDKGLFVTLYFVGIGFTIATCLTLGVIVVRKVESKSLTESRGKFWIMIWSGIGAVLPPLVMISQGFLDGKERGFAVMALTLLTFGIGLASIVGLTLTINYGRKK